jgi:transposase
VARPILPDALWAVVEPVLPPHPPRPKGGRPPITHRQALTGILFVLKTGLPWEDLPAEMGCGSGMSCWRRLAAWQADGTWTRLHALLLERLHDAGKLDWRRAAIDSSSVRAVFGGRRPAPTPRIGRKPAPSTT